MICTNEAKSEQNLNRSRYVSVRNEKNWTSKVAEKLSSLRMKDKELQTAQACRMKDRFHEIFQYRNSQEFESGLKEWVSWLMRSRLVAIKEVAKTTRRRWNGITSWLASTISNGILEGLNSAFLAAKVKALSYKRLETIKNVNYLLRGSLNYSSLNSCIPI